MDKATRDGLKTIVQTNIENMQDIVNSAFIKELISDCERLEHELTELKKKHSASPNANTVLGDGWRDVKKELPKIPEFLVSDDVLFCSDGKVHFGHYHVNGFFYDSKKLYAIAEKNVTAWRQLPNPPAFT